MENYLKSFLFIKQIGRDTKTICKQGQVVMVGLGVTFPTKTPKSFQAHLWLLWGVGERKKNLKIATLFKDLSVEQLHDLYKVANKLSQENDHEKN